MPSDIEVMNEAIELPFFYLDDTVVRSGADSDDWQYQNFQRTRTDLPTLTQDRQLLWSLYLYQSNPIAHRYIELLNAFTLGDGPTVIARDEKVQELIDEFWFNDHNDWPQRVLSFGRDLAIYGEMVLTFGRLDGADGKSPIIGMQYINPRDIHHVLADTRDRSKIDKVILKKKALPGISLQSDPRLVLDVVKGGPPVKGKRRLDGNAFFFRINQVADATRGLSDIFPLVDWLQLYNDYQYNMIERLGHMTMYFFDVVLKDADEQAIKKFREQILRQPPKPGALVVHNDRASLTAQSVDLHGADMVAASQNFMSIIFTGLGWPAHWTAMPSSGNRATAEAAADPVLRSFLARQSLLRNFLSKILQYQIDVAALADHFGDTVNEEFKLVFPKLGLRDFQRSGGTASRIASALKDSTEVGLIDQKVANRLLMLAFEQAGLLADDFSGPPSTQRHTTNDESDDGDDGMASKLQRASASIGASTGRLSTLLSSMEDVVDGIMESKTLPDENTKALAINEWRRILAYHLL